MKPVFQLHQVQSGEHGIYRWQGMTPEGEFYAEASKGELRIYIQNEKVATYECHAPITREKILNLSNYVEKIENDYHSRTVSSFAFRIWNPQSCKMHYCNSLQELRFFEDLDVIVMAKIGISDGDKDVYELDIIEYQLSERHGDIRECGVVEYADKSASFVIKRGKTSMNLPFALHMNRGHVIGNVFENPELFA